MSSLFKKITLNSPHPPTPLIRCYIVSVSVKARDDGIKSQVEIKLEIMKVIGTISGPLHHHQSKHRQVNNPGNSKGIYNLTHTLDPL